MKTKEELMTKTLRQGLSPIEKISVSEWADKYRIISAGNAEPGKWRTSRVPYMKEVMDAFTQPDVEKIVVKSAAQVSKTEVLLNVLGRFAHVDPCSILLINPTLEMSNDFSKARLTRMIADTKALTPLFYGEKATSVTRDSNQTLLSKFYVGGRIVLAGANSPAGLASRPIRILLCDEVDRFPPTAGAEGDPLSIAEKRTTTFWNRKIGLFSTPTTKGASRIDVEYDLGTQERWEHACPNCQEYHTLNFHQLNSEFTETRDARDRRVISVKSVTWRCPDCGFAFDEVTIKNSPQRYHADNPRAIENGVRSFYITGLYSPWISWRDIMQEWYDAQGKPDLEKVVFNTRFGLSYEMTGMFGDLTELERRREDYGAEIPDGVLLLTAGVDVQDRRLEYEIVGWGIGEECWGILKGEIPGRPNNILTWDRLDDILDREYRSRRDTFRVARTFIDSGGHFTSSVYEYCQRNMAKWRFAIKGLGGVGYNLLHKTTWSRKYNLPLYLLGVNEGKQEIYSRLTITVPGDQYFHFPKDDNFMPNRGYNETYFKGLTAEKKVLRQSGAQTYEMWVRIDKRRRNEPLDLRVYALAAMRSFGLIDWGNLRTPIEPPKEDHPVKTQMSIKPKPKKTWTVNVW